MTSLYKCVVQIPLGPLWSLQTMKSVHHVNLTLCADCPLEQHPDPKNKVKPSLVRPPSPLSVSHEPPKDRQATLAIHYRYRHRYDTLRDPHEPRTRPGSAAEPCSMRNRNTSAIYTNGIETLPPSIRTRNMAAR